MHGGFLGGFGLGGGGLVLRAAHKRGEQDLPRRYPLRVEAAGPDGAGRVGAFHPGVQRPKAVERVSHGGAVISRKQDAHGRVVHGRQGRRRLRKQRLEQGRGRVSGQRQGQVRVAGGGLQALRPR